MEEFHLKLLFAVFDKLPSQSLMYIGNFICNAFKDSYLLELKKVFLKEQIYEEYFDCCFELSNKTITYMKQELKDNDSIICYFCRYIIMCNDKILLNVYDNDFYTIDESLLISNDLIRECEMHGLKIDIDSNIDL